jgi:serine/threonine protein kinase
MVTSNLQISAWPSMYVLCCVNDLDICFIYQTSFCWIYIIFMQISAYTSIKSFKGSPYWMAPEVKATVIFGAFSLWSWTSNWCPFISQVIMNTNGYSLSVDIWSLGCTILEMATARPPWSQYEGVRLFRWFYMVMLVVFWWLSAKLS